MFILSVFISSVKKDDQNGRNTGIAFCEFANEQQANYAKENNNKKDINGRKIRIDNPDGGKKGTAVAVCIRAHPMIYRL